MREDSADARGGGAGIFAHGGCGEALSVVRDEGARAVAMVGNRFRRPKSIEHKFIKKNRKLV